jgi:hypothetical protein
MCEKIIERIPSLTAEERLQLRHNCRRAVARSADALVVQEAKRVLNELDALEQEETETLARLPWAQRIEYAFRRLPATEHERDAIRLLHDLSIAAEAGEGPAAVEAETDDAWLRHIGEICRMRRHLLRAAEQPRWDEQPAPDTGTLAQSLLQVDEVDGTVRLRPEAVEAFSSLGYVAARAA